MNDQHREYCRRQHRILAQYLAVCAWLQGVDCIALEAHHLKRFLGLERIRGTRRRWLCNDVRPWFPYQHTYDLTGTEASLHSIFLSRVPVSEFLSNDSLTTPRRIRRMGKNSPKTRLFLSLTGRKAFPNEEEIISHLAQLSAGLMAPKRK